MSTDTIRSETETNERATEDVVLETHPAIKPVVLRAVLLAGFISIAYVYVRLNPRILGDVNRAETALAILLLVGIILGLRYLVRIVVLLRTRYIVTSDSIRREFNLLMRTHSREVPFELIRSYELDQSRIEYVFGYGTITVNRGLGTLQLDNAPDPHELYDRLQERVN